MTNSWQVIVVLVAIFSSQWLAMRHTDRQIDTLRSHLVDTKEGLSKQMADLKELVEAKLETVRVEIANLNGRVKRIEDQLDQILKPTLRGK